MAHTYDFRKFTAMATLLLLVVCVFNAADGRIIESTSNSEVIIGDSIELVCKSSIPNHVLWKHIPLGATEWNSVNTNGKLTPEYAARFQLNGNNLVIKVVLRDDAGKYICIEDMGRGERIFIEISVLESLPQCLTNINRIGTVTENDFGIQPEDIFLICSLTYYENIAPELEWKASDESDISGSINISNKLENNGRKIMIQAVIQAILLQDGTQYVCQTKLSKEKYPCYSAMVKTMYLFNSPVETLMLNEPRLIKCSANTSQTCKYTWMTNEENSVVSTREYLDLFALQNESGISEYICTAECELRNKIFKVMPMIVKFELLGNQLSSQDCGSGLSVFCLGTNLVLIIVAAIIILLIYIFHHRKVIRRELSKMIRCLDNENEETKGLLEDENEDQEVLLKDYSAETAIQGLAIIKKKLFVCAKNSNTILVFEAQEPYHKLNDEIHVKGLENPVDMTSAKDSNSHKHCLYITADSEKNRQNVWKIKFLNLSGKIKTKAPTCYTVESGWPHTISAANDGQLLITKEGRPPKLLIHEINYGKFESIDLPDEVKLPRHAVSNEKNFIVSHSDGICKIDRSGKVLQSFDLPPHNLLVNLNEYLTHMTTDGRRIYATDYSNHCVLCFDPESQEKVVLFHEFGEDEWPTRVLYNKLNNHLLIGVESGKVHVRPTKNGMETWRVERYMSDPSIDLFSCEVRMETVEVQF